MKTLILLIIAGALTLSAQRGDPNPRIDTPEPASAIFMALGFGAIGIAAAYSRRKKAKRVE